MFRKIFGVLGKLWWLLDQTRRALVNLLLLALLVGGIVWLATRGPATLKDKTVLVLAPAGVLTDQAIAGGARDTALGVLRGEDNAQTRLRDWAAVLDAAARDDKVPHALLLLDDFAGAGMASLREAAAAMERFKSAGKKIYAWGLNYDQRGYYLAAHASEVWLSPQGSVLIEGMGRHRTYYKNAFDRFGVQANVVRAGKYKNAAEVFSAAGPSPETLESEGALWGALWASYTGGVEKARKLPAGSVMRYIDGMPGNLQAVGGNTARLALDSKLVDALKTRDEMRALLIERGALDDKAKTFRQTAFGEVLARVKPKTDGDAVAVIVAQGEIGDGRAPSGRVGGLSTAELVKQAREDDKVRAVVLRVNSPGGSAFGSELVRRELVLTRQAGKPVVVSMGDLAASGGYWISMAADEVIADEASITGSIGVVGMLPSVKGALDKVGITTGGSTTAWLVGAFDPRRELDPRAAALVQSAIGHAYTDFTKMVADSRKSTPEKIDELGQGRVWSGRDAHKHGLVDRLGSFADAVKSAAERAKLPADARLAWIEVEPGRLHKLAQQFGGAAAALGVKVDLPAAARALGLLDAPLGAGVAHELAWLADVAERREPFKVVAHCLCSAY
jgi:protease-4